MPLPPLPPLLPPPWAFVAAQELGWEREYIQLHRDTTVQQLTLTPTLVRLSSAASSAAGRWVCRGEAASHSTRRGPGSTKPQVDGVVSWEDSPLVRAVREGRVLMIDEADKAPVEVVGILKGTLHPVAAACARARVRVCVRAVVCACVCVFACACVHACMRACIHSCVRACARARACVCVPLRPEIRRRFASTAHAQCRSSSAIAIGGPVRLQSSRGVQG